MDQPFEAIAFAVRERFACYPAHPGPVLVHPKHPTGDPVEVHFAGGEVAVRVRAPRVGPRGRRLPVGSAWEPPAPPRELGRFELADPESLDRLFDLLAAECRPVPADALAGRG